MLSPSIFESKKRKQRRTSDDARIRCYIGPIQHTPNAHKQRSMARIPGLPKLFPKARKGNFGTTRKPQR